MAEVTVLGGTGYLGRRIVEALVARGDTVRVATRHPERSDSMRTVMRSRTATGAVRLVRTDIRDAATLTHAVRAADGVVNAVGLYVERGAATFEAVHVEGARRVAGAVRDAAVPRLLHISGIGADPHSRSRYVRARGRGELAVREVLPTATILRPSALFAESGGLIANLADPIRRSPVFPLFGLGRTRLQPVFADDVAEAAARALGADWTKGRVFELGGPRIYSYRQLVRLVMRATGHSRLLLPVPFVFWDLLAALAERLPTLPVTEGQVALMRRDNIVGDAMPDLAALGIRSTPLETVLDQHWHEASPRRWG